MTVRRVEVDVALARPPRVDATVFVEVEARTTTEAHVIACQLAACDRRVVMVVGSRVISTPRELAADMSDTRATNRPAEGLEAP